jgi:hypothetical protein
MERVLTSDLTMNTTFMKAMERELKKALLEQLRACSRLGILSVSLKVARDHLSRGEAVVKTRSGRPKKVVRDVNESDIIADLTAKAASDTTQVIDEEPSALPCEKAAVKSSEKAALKATKAALKATKAATKAAEKAAKLALKSQLAKAKKETRRLEKEAKAAAKARAKEEKTAAKKALKAEKAAKAAATLDRKTKEAKAIQAQFKMKNAILEEDPIVNDVDIIDTSGEIVGNKVESFTVPPCPKEVKKQQSLKKAGLTAFTHNSRPNDELYMDIENCVFKYTLAVEEGGKDTCDHIGDFNPDSGALISVSDSASEDESDMDDLSDTE